MATAASTPPLPPPPGQPEFVRFDRFAERLLSKLDSAGWFAIADRFPVAANELDMLRFQGRALTEDKTTWVLNLVLADGFQREQTRYMSDQHYNALALEKNALADNPTRVRGCCLFVYEGKAPKEEVDFLMGQTRADALLATIRSSAWVIELQDRVIHKPKRSPAPFPDEVVLSCI